MRHCGRQKAEKRFAASGIRSLFLWLNKILFLGFRRIVSIDDLPDLSCEFSSKTLWKEFAPVWAKSTLSKIRWSTANWQSSFTASKRSQYCLIKACFRTFPVSFLIIPIPQLCLSVFIMLRPLYIQRAVEFMTEHNGSDNVRNGLIGAIILLIAGSAVSKLCYLFVQTEKMLRAFRFLKQLRCTCNIA